MGKDNVIELTEVLGTSSSRVRVYALGDLEGVLEKPFLDLLETIFQHNGEYYEPPVSFDGLTKLLRANAHHESAIHCKQATVVKGYRPGQVQVLKRRGMKAVVNDYLVTGNAFLQKVVDRAGRVRELRHLHARTMRRHREENTYLQIVGGQRKVFRPDEVIHALAYAPESSVYGLPEYLGAINSILLNESGTLFRRRYYANGAHLGFLLFTKGEDVDEDDLKELGKKIKESKGVGNFKSTLVHLPGDGAAMELIPVGDFAKDDFEKVKTISRDDIISAHRVPPQILAVLTDNKVPAQGDLDKIVKLYNLNVVEPIQLDIADAINEHLDSDQQISFDPYLLIDDGAPDSAQANGTTDGLPNLRD